MKLPLNLEHAFLGFYKGGSFNFTVTISPNYPHEAPKVKCTQKVSTKRISPQASSCKLTISFVCFLKIYHPNLDLEGNVCLNILREDWKPVCTCSASCASLRFTYSLTYSGSELERRAGRHAISLPGAVSCARIDAILL